MQCRGRYRNWSAQSARTEGLERMLGGFQVFPKNSRSVCPTAVARVVPSPLSSHPLALAQHVPHRCCCKHDRLHGLSRAQLTILSPTLPFQHPSPVDFAGSTLDSLISSSRPRSTCIGMYIASTTLRHDNASRAALPEIACRPQDPRSSFRLGVLSLLSILLLRTPCARRTTRTWIQNCTRRSAELRATEFELDLGQRDYNVV